MDCCDLGFVVRQDAVAALRTEQRVKRELAARNAELEAAAAAAREVDEPASPPAPAAAAAADVLRPPSPDEKLQHLLSEERQRTADLQRVRQLCRSSMSSADRAAEARHGQ